MKKIIVLLIVLALAFSAVGCATPQPTPQPLATPSNPNPDVVEELDGYIELGYENGYEYEEAFVFEGERYGEREFSDENVNITIFFDRPQFTHNDIVGLHATITNIGEEIVVFTKGSGSNRVPDALQVNLGEMTALFRPGIQTNDLQTSSLAPGESVTFPLPFAPYMYADTEAMFPPPVGFDRDIEFFRSDEWIRVEEGEIEGTISFSYVTRGPDDFFIIVEGDEIYVLEDNFAVNLTEHMMSGTPTAPEAANGEAEEQA